MVSLSFVDILVFFVDIILKNVILNSSLRYIYIRVYVNVHQDYIYQNTYTHTHTLI